MLEGFKAFNFNEGSLFISVTKNGITFNKNAIVKLNYPNYVCFLINSEEKKVAIQVSSKDTENATGFCSEEKKNKKVLSVRWNSRDLINSIKGITGWELETSGYRIEGKFYPEDDAIVFDLNNAKPLK